MAIRFLNRRGFLEVARLGSVSRAFFPEQKCLVDIRRTGGKYEDFGV